MSSTSLLLRQLSPLSRVRNGSLRLKLHSANEMRKSGVSYESEAPSRQLTIMEKGLPSPPLDWPPSSASSARSSSTATSSAASSTICSVQDNLSRMRIISPAPRPPTPYVLLPFGLPIFLTASRIPKSCAHCGLLLLVGNSGQCLLGDYPGSRFVQDDNPALL